MEQMRSALEALYQRETVAANREGDPVLFAHRHPSDETLPVAALISAAFAFGRVSVMLKSLADIFNRLDGNPVSRISGLGNDGLSERFHGFRYRYVGEKALVGLLTGLSPFCRGNKLVDCCEGTDPFIWATRIREAILDATAHPDELAGSNLLADPEKGSASKRWMLFFRWMVRRDAVDPGPWNQQLSAEHLVVPLDTHMLRIARYLGLTRRRDASRRTAMEITEGFRRIRPDDPVRYDFALARLGIDSRCTVSPQQRQCVSCALHGVCSPGRMAVSSNIPKGNPS